MGRGTNQNRVACSGFGKREATSLAVLGLYNVRAKSIWVRLAR
jgi:hypothetical protein